MATALDPDRPGRKTYAKAHLEDNGHTLIHQHYSVDERGKERLVLEWRMTKK